MFPDGLLVRIALSGLADAALGMEVEAKPGCTEGSLELLTAALQELRAAMTDPAQYGGENGSWAGSGAVCGHGWVSVAGPLPQGGRGWYLFLWFSVW